MVWTLVNQSSSSQQNQLASLKVRHIFPPTCCTAGFRGKSSYGKFTARICFDKNWVMSGTIAIRTTECNTTPEEGATVRENNYKCSCLMALVPQSKLLIYCLPRCYKPKHCARQAGIANKQLTVHRVASLISFSDLVLAITYRSALVHRWGKKRSAEVRPYPTCGTE